MIEIIIIMVIILWLLNIEVRVWCVKSNLFEIENM